MTVPPNVGSNEYGLDESAVVPVIGGDDDLPLVVVADAVVVVTGWNASTVVVCIPDDSSNASNSIASRDSVEVVMELTVKDVLDMVVIIWGSMVGTVNYEYS